MAVEWDQRFVDLSKSVVPDIARIRVVLDQMGIRNGDFDDPVDYVASAFALAAAMRRALAFQAALVKADLIDSSRVGGGGAVDIEAELFGQLAKLQSFTSAVYTPTDARVAAKRMLRATDLVCRIEIDRKQVGTGVLVARTLIATAAHVVQPLVEASPAGVPSEAAGSTSRITVTFGDVTDLLDDDDSQTRLPGRLAPLADPWLAFYSPPTPDETASDFVIDNIEGIDSVDGPWDVAILRLASAQTARPPEARTELPRKPFQVHVLHHPSTATGAAEPLLWSIGQLDRRLGEPPLRLLHSANTKEGSSGAPVFDSEFRVVGLHQAGAGQRSQSEDARNRAVPVLPWGPSLRQLEGERSAVPYLTTVQVSDVWGLEQPRVVIGRRETQLRIWRSLQAGATTEERFVRVVGRPMLGLRFTKLLVHAMVTPREGLYASIDVSNCQRDDEPSFAGLIAGAFAAPHPTDGETGLTTKQRDVRNLTIPRLVERLSTLSVEPGAWLVLEGFDAVAERPSPHVEEVVRQLVSELDRMPGLRLVVVGWGADLPPRWEPSTEYLQEPPTGEDIARTLYPPNTPTSDLRDTIVEAQAALVTARQTAPGAPPYHLAAAVRAQLAPAIEARLRARVMREGR